MVALDEKYPVKQGKNVELSMGIDFLALNIATKHMSLTKHWKHHCYINEQLCWFDPKTKLQYPVSHHTVDSAQAFGYVASNQYCLPNSTYNPHFSRGWCSLFMAWHRPSIILNALSAYDELISRGMIDETENSKELFVESIKINRVEPQLLLPQDIGRELLHAMKTTRDRAKKGWKIYPDGGVYVRGHESPNSIKTVCYEGIDPQKPNFEMVKIENGFRYSWWKPRRKDTNWTIPKIEEAAKPEILTGWKLILSHFPEQKGKIFDLAGATTFTELFENLQEARRHQPQTLLFKPLFNPKRL